MTDGKLVESGKFVKGRWIESGYHISEDEHNSQIEHIKRLQSYIKALVRTNDHLAERNYKYECASVISRIRYLLTGVLE